MLFALAVISMCVAALFASIVVSRPEKIEQPSVVQRQSVATPREEQEPPVDSGSNFATKHVPVAESDIKEKSRAAEKKADEKSMAKGSTLEVKEPVVAKKTNIKQKQNKKINNQNNVEPKKTETKKLPGGAGAIEDNKGNKIEPKPLFDIPQAKNGATLYLVFDDAGQNTSYLKRYVTLPMHIAVAVLPKLAHSKECAAMIRSSGNTVMLHQPMQALNANVNPGPGAIMPEMGVQEIMNIIKTNIAEVGPVAGINNHEGSRICENEIQIGAVLDETIAEGVFFLDSRTTAQTRAPQAALERGINIYERDVFLDDTVNRHDILEQVYRALAIANKKGHAVIIGHIDKSADIIPSLLREMYPDLIRQGYTFGVLK